jgi:hypothetical protein
MGTYAQIQDYTKREYGYKAKTCWIADVKDGFGLITRKAHNRKSFQRIHPCPENKKENIVEALRYFKMIN